MDVGKKDNDFRGGTAACSLISVVAGLLLFGGLAGCEGSDPGTGTQSLHVEAFAVSAGTRDSTEVRVQVRRGDSGGRILSDARVRVRGRDEGEWTLEFVGIDWGPFVGGFHRVDKLDWQRGWHLEVEAGEDDWLEAYLAVPGATRITEPIANTSYRPNEGEPLQVRWEDESGRSASSASVELNRNDYSIRLDGDTSRHEIAPSIFRRDGSERVTVERWTEVDLAGGARGSFFKGTTKHLIDFRVE